MSVDAVSPEEIERTRKVGARNQAVILQRIARVTQARAAACMDVSPSTVSRMVEDAARWGHLLASVGIQLAAPGAMVVDPAELKALRRFALKYLEACEQQDQFDEVGQ